MHYILYILYRAELAITVKVLIMATVAKLFLLSALYCTNTFLCLDIDIDTYVSMIALVSEESSNIHFSPAVTGVTGLLTQPSKIRSRGEETAPQ